MAPIYTQRWHYVRSLTNHTELMVALRRLWRWQRSLRRSPALWTNAKQALVWICSPPHSSALEWQTTSTLQGLWTNLPWVGWSRPLHLSTLLFWNHTRSTQPPRRTMWRAGGVVAATLFDKSEAIGCFWLFPPEKPARLATREVRIRQPTPSQWLRNGRCAAAQALRRVVQACWRPDGVLVSLFLLHFGWYLG